ncbi:MAG: hypothetical protein R6X20_00145 [Phycisphaerae bacterium]
MTGHQALVLGYLSRHCRGRARARTQAKIAADLRGLGVEMTARDVRDLLADLVLDGQPIGTTAGRPAGAFLCESREDFLAAYGNLYKRVRRQARRCDRFKQTARAALSGQFTFDFAAAAARFDAVADAPLLAAAAEAGEGRTP